jgi:hypothetical protein
MKIWAARHQGPKVRIVYDRRAKVIVTVLPLKLDPNRPRRLKTLTV